MMFEKQDTNRFIVYSNYGLQSHLVVNNYGVSFSCNAKVGADGMALAFESKELAESNKDKFFDRIAEVQCCAKIERFFGI